MTTTLDPAHTDRTRSEVPRRHPSRTGALPDLATITGQIALLLVGLNAGFFFTYEASVTLGLARVDDPTYVATFQAINETVRNPAFAAVFFGSVPVLALASVVAGGGARRRHALGLVAFGVGIAITVVGNLPLNAALADAGAVDGAAATAARAAFEAEWNRFNLARTIAFTTSFALVIDGLRAQARHR